MSDLCALHYRDALDEYKTRLCEGNDSALPDMITPNPSTQGNQS